MSAPTPVRRRFVRGLVPVLLLALAACGRGEAASPAAPSLDTVASGALTACMDMPYEPFEFRQNGELKGIDVDLVRTVAADLGVRAEFHEVDFDDIFAALDRRECDLVASAVSITPERQQAHIFSSGYFEVSQSLLVRSADRSRFSGLESLRGRKVGVQKATTGADYAADHAPEAKLVRYEDASEMVHALETSAVDGVIQDFPINSYEARNSPALAVVSTFTDVDREQYGFALRPGSEKLRDSVDESLRRIRQDGRYDDILIDYLGSALTGD